MPSAANAKSEKPASSEATDNSPVRQIMTVIEHKIRNLEKRKSKLTSYRDLQKAGKDLNSDQKVAVAKYDEVAQTLEFARDLSKQVSQIAISAERDAKKQAKKEAWVRYAVETSKIREVLLILDCLMQMGNSEARDDFLNGTNGACKLTEEDLKILDDLYPEVTPKHELNEEGQPGFHTHTTKAAEHLYAIIEGKPKEILGTTYAHIKTIITSVHECGYFDKGDEAEVAEPVESEAVEQSELEPEPEHEHAAAPPGPPAPAPPLPADGEVGAVYVAVPPPVYPMRPLPPITLQEVEHAYFSQQYPQQRPISEVIGSQNFFFLQESEIDSPAGTPQPPLLQPSPPGPIPTQTFTNQHFVPLAEVPQPHFPPPPEHAAFPPPPAPVQLPAPLPPPPTEPPAPSAPAAPVAPAADHKPADDEWQESQSPERDDNNERKTQGQGDGQARFRRYGRGGGRGAPNGYRGRGGRQEHADREYRPRAERNAHPRHYQDGYQPRHRDRADRDSYYGNGDAHEHHAENGRDRDRDRYHDSGPAHQGYKPRGRGPPRSSAPRGPRVHYPRRNEPAE